MTDFYLVNSIFFFLVNIIGLLLAFWVLNANVRFKMNQSFFVMTMFILGWINLVYLSDLPSQANNALLWNKLIFGVVFLVFISFYFFSIYFPKEEETESHLLDTLIFSEGIFFAFCAVFTDFFVQGIKSNEWGTEIIFGKGSSLFFGMVILQALFIIGRLLKKYYRSTKEEKTKIEYFLVGIIIFVFMILSYSSLIKL